MNTAKPNPPVRRSAHSFEVDSLAWWGKSGIWIVAILAVAIYGMTRPHTIICRKSPAQTEAVSNARQIGLALSEFQSNYGKMPDASTVDLVKLDTNTDLNLGTKSSNDFFRQLFATGITQSESIFYAKIEGSQKPDDIFTKTEALKKGECGFTYFPGALKTDNPSRPVAATPMIPGTDRFDPEPFKGKAIILRADNSVSSYQILLKTGHATIHGNNLMDPTNPVWDGYPPVIAWPDL